MARLEKGGFGSEDIYQIELKPEVKAADEKKNTSRTPDCVYVGTPNDVVAKMLEMAKIRRE